MNGKFSRDKGARAERELCGLLREYLGVEATRNLKQFQQAQHGDIDQLVGPYLIEVKNHEKITLRPWWDQITAAARERGGVPCVAFRLQNRGLYDRWQFLVPDSRDIEFEWQLEFRRTAVLGLDAFADRVRERL